MAITLVTGQPGHGKTQWAIAEARKLAGEGRTVFAGNVRGLKHGDAGFISLDSFEQWEALPDGSVVLWDECYNALPARASGRAVPDHVEALARHRHRGFDFLLICQQPKQIDSFVVGLVERHIHCRRRFGTSLVRLREWDRMERDPDKATALVTSNWTLDKSVWALYESATVHTVKRRIPWYVYALPALIIAVLVAGYSVPQMLFARGETMPAAAAGAQAASRVGGPSQPLLSIAPAQPEVLRQSNPMELLRPRVAGSPWTAPAYDGLPLLPPPRIACIASEAKCLCLTVDQGTRYLVEETMCRHIARFGRYDPIQREEAGGKGADLALR